MPFFSPGGNGGGLTLTGQTIETALDATNPDVLLHMDGADGSTTFTDNGTGSASWTANGDAQIDTAITKFGTGSGLFDGTGDYISTPGGSQFQLVGEFTLSAWVNTTYTGGWGAIIGGGGDDSEVGSAYVVRVLDAADAGKIQFQFYEGGTTREIKGTTNIADGSWHHVAVTRDSGNTARLFIDGTQEGPTWNSAGNSNLFTDPFAVGANYYSHVAGILEPFNGQIDEVEIIIGHAKWTGNFTPPTSPSVNPTVVSAKDPVYYDASETTWRRATGTTARPTGLYAGTSGQIATSGEVTGLTGLTAGTNYYLSGSGGLGTDESETGVFIGRSLSTTVLQLMIDDNSGGNTPLQFGGRLTLTQDDPEPSADQDAQTTLYYEPFTSDKIWLYDGSSEWGEFTISGQSVAASGLTADKNHDIFAYDSGGLTLEAVEWTNDTTRATSHVYQDGVRVKAGEINKVYLGTVRTISSTGTKFQDGRGQRYVWNMYNRLVRPAGIYDGVGSHTYTTAVIREFTGSTTYGKTRMGFVVGIGGAYSASSSTSIQTSVGNVQTIGGLSLNAVATPTDSRADGLDASGVHITTMASPFLFEVVAGWHYLVLVESSSALGTTTWYDSLSSAILPIEC